MLGVSCFGFQVSGIELCILGFGLGFRVLGFGYRQSPLSNGPVFITKTRAQGTHLNHISHCKTASGTNWVNRWAYRVSSINTRRDEMTGCLCVLGIGAAGLILEEKLQFLLGIGVIRLCLNLEIGAIRFIWELEPLGLFSPLCPGGGGGGRGAAGAPLAARREHGAHHQHSSGFRVQG